MALGWLSLRKDGRAGAVARDARAAVGRIGYSVIESQGDWAGAEIHNLAGGMGKINERKGIIRRALAAQRADMLAYIARKEAEGLRGAVRGK
jgi:hypothetical protein